MITLTKKTLSTTTHDDDIATACALFVLDEQPTRPKKETITLPPPQPQVIIEPPQPQPQPQLPGPNYVQGTTINMVHPMLRAPVPMIQNFGLKLIGFPETRTSEWLEIGRDQFGRFYCLKLITPHTINWIPITPNFQVLQDAPLVHPHPTVLNGNQS